MTNDDLSQTLQRDADLKAPPMIYFGTRHRPSHIQITDVIGMIPEFLDPSDPRPAAEQIAENYIGGWRPSKGFSWDQFTGALTYPGDPAIYPWVSTSLRDELILIYEYGYTLIGQPDGSFAVSRLD